MSEGRGQPVGKRPTVYDVATLAGVSIATVSFAFTKPDRVKRETLRNVLAAADSIGYVPSANARGLARGVTGAVGLYAFDYLLEATMAGVEEEPPEISFRPAGRLFPLYADEVQRGVQLECRQQGYALMLGAGRNPGHLPNVIDVAGRVDGLIAFAGAADSSTIDQVATRIPVVELGGEVRREGTHTVFVDNGPAMARLTHHLVEDHGYRRFAFVGSSRTAEFVARYEGFAATLTAAGVPVSRPLASQPGDDASTVAAVEHLLTTGGTPEVVVCSTDQEALVAIDALRVRGVAVPATVAVTGFDGILAGSLSRPTLTTVRQPMEQVGRTAVRILLEVLDASGSADRHETLPSSVWVGGSCGCPEG